MALLLGRRHQPKGSTARALQAGQRALTKKLSQTTSSTTSMTSKLAISRPPATGRSQSQFSEEHTRHILPRHTSG